MGPMWEFVVEHAFQVTGRGVGVIGRLYGEIPFSPFSAVLTTPTETVSIAKVSIEFARIDGGEKLALVLWDEFKDRVPAGSVLRPSLPHSR